MIEPVARILRELNDGPPAKSPAERRQAFAKLCSFAGEPEPRTRWWDESLAVRDGSSVIVRFYEGSPAHSSRPLLLYFHGGGYVAGDLDTHHAALTQLAEKTTALIAHVDYRRGPEHRYPTALHDGEDTLDNLRARATELGFDPRRIVVAGDSAGGNLAAVLSLTRRHRIAHQLLLYPTLDAFFVADSWQRFPQGFIASASDAREFNLLYAQDEGDFADPLFSPVLASDLVNLPPATLFAGEFDPAQGDSEFYAARLRNAGVTPTFHRCANMIHGFFTMTRELAGARDLHDQMARLCDQVPAR